LLDDWLIGNLCLVTGIKYMYVKALMYYIMNMRGWIASDCKGIYALGVEGGNKRM